MSTFGSLNTAYLGLSAAQQAMNLAGQNIANAGTEGYTRQRINQSSISAPAVTGIGATQMRPGQGVSVDGIARLGSGILDAGVRSSRAQSGFASARSEALQGIERVLQEPGENGVSAALQAFWAAWQGAANKPGEAAPAGALLQAANSLTDRISSAYTSLDAQWTGVRGQAETAVNTLNQTASQVAAYNASIRSALAAGGSANELIDARSKLTEIIAGLAGGSVREAADGTVDVYVGGNAIVSGTTARSLVLTGKASMDQSGSVVQLEWADRPGAAAGLDGGTLAGALSVLAPADSNGSAGAIAQAAAAYNALAEMLMGEVNAVHATGLTPGGAMGQPFFDAGSTTGPLALRLKVVPTEVSGIAVRDPAAGPLDGSIADRIAQIGSRPASPGNPASPDAFWTDFVTGIGVQSRGAQQHEILAETAQAAAESLRASGASVSLDEENISLLASQHAYQAAARVLTAVDEALDVLINRTGLVGR